MKSKIPAVLGVIVILVIAALYILASGSLPFSNQWWQNLNPFNRPPPVITISDAVITDIQQVSRLTTTIYTVQRVVEDGDKGSNGKYDCGFIFNPLDYWMAMVVKGQVEAGLDLDQLDASRVVVSEDGKIITVYLPPVTILTDRGHILSSNPVDTYVYAKCQGPGWLLAPNKTDLKNLESRIRARAGDSILETACTDGILDQANEDARRVIESFLKTTQPDIQITIESAPVPSPEDCKKMGMIE